MSRRGAVRPGCLVFAALTLLAVAAAWKSIDFFILRPAGVKAVLNDVYDTVRTVRNPEIKKINFLTNWSAMRDTTSSEYILRCTRPTFGNDTVYVQYSDTLYLPVIGAWDKTFRVTRIF